jgi:hypothetical protein
MQLSFLAQNPPFISVFCDLFTPMAQPNLSKTWWHTTKCCLMKRGYETIHGHKHASTHKYLPYKNAGIWKQNITRVG